MHDRIEPPAWSAFAELGLEPLKSIDLFVDCAHGLLKNDLLRRRRADDFREVPLMRCVPVGTPDIMQPEPKQERCPPSLGMCEREAGGVSGSTPIADRFVIDRRHVDAREMARAQQPRQVERIAPIGLDLVARFFGMSEGATT